MVDTRTQSVVVRVVFAAATVFSSLPLPLPMLAWL